MRLSQNFSLKEMLFSETAARDPVLSAAQDAADDTVISNLRHLCRVTLQPLRDEMAWPIRVTSGYRSPKLNAHIRGSSQSQHCLGEAADIQVSNPEGFLESSETLWFRVGCQLLYKEQTGLDFPDDSNANFYMFVAMGLALEEWDVDQLIHEYGDAWGRPAWVHVAASRRQNRRRITVVGPFTDRKYLHYVSLGAAGRPWQQRGGAHA